MNDREVKNLKEIMEKERLPWRSFAYGEELYATWSMPGSPVYYILDPLGVIRHKWTGYPGEKALDGALEELIREAEREAGKK